MVARILPEWEWPRLADTGCCVDQSWRDRATQGCVVSVEQGPAIMATAFVFLTADGVPHVDGLWVRSGWRGRVTVLRPLRRAIKFAVDHLGGDTWIPIDAAAGWMTRPERRGHGVQLV